MPSYSILVTTAEGTYSYTGPAKLLRWPTLTLACATEFPSDVFERHRRTPDPFPPGEPEIADIQLVNEEYYSIFCFEYELAPSGRRGYPAGVYKRYS